ncbi:MAG: cation diffusion facilitator family transporter, partial [Bacteroidales bacterium]
AMESIVNVVAGLVSLYALHLAMKPKDKSHPFGHGKVEFFSASVEGLLIMMAGGIIIFEGVSRLLEPANIRQLDIGIWIVALAGVVNYAMGFYSIYLGKKYDSVALIASGKHLQSDTYSSIGLVIGLLLLYYTGLPWIDGLLACVFGLLIFGTGISILHKTTNYLMDRADESILKDVAQCLSANPNDQWVDIHNLKMIKYGSSYFLDCDLTLPWFYDIKQGHELCDSLKEVLSMEFADRLSVSVHTDPCSSKHCSRCRLSNCMHRCYPMEEAENFSLNRLLESDE